MYSRDKRRRKANHIEEDDKLEVESVILNLMPHEYPLQEQITTDLLSVFCCCCTKLECLKERKKRHEAHEQAKERLKNEMDILNFVSASRTQKLIS